MDSVLPNGEPKKIILTKQPEEAEANKAPSPPPQRPIRGFAGSRVRIPPRRHFPPVDTNPEEHLTNHRKQRYWNSWEELYIVELWRRYKDEVTAINVPLPVYRKIMISMRNRNMVVTAQDCRRKINTLNTKYKQELKRIESTGCKSDWRLFPLLHCIMCPKIKEFDAWHETKIIKNLLDKIPKPVEEKSVPLPATINITNSQNLSTKVLQNSQPNINRSIQHTLPTLNQSTSQIDTSLANKLPTKPSILPFRKITWEKLEQIRRDNIRLALERDESLQQLHLEEREFQYFEKYIQTWKEQKELELKSVRKITEKCNFNIENEENHTVEHQLQHETVCIK